MRIVKDLSAGLLFGPFAVGGVWALQAAVLHYFELKNPDQALSEQDMWQELAPFLGPGGLDWGFPKQRAEVLATGKWFAPQGRPAPGGSVSLEVGPIKRSLLVFGPRYWQMGPAGPRPSPPETVPSVELNWQNAFGGPGFAENPHGIGYLAQDTPWGEARRYLPAVEEPGFTQLTNPWQTPPPASLAPLPPEAASRTALAGTYDEQWKKLYWPGFPPDVHPDYFQMAQPACRLAQGYFRGGEKVVLSGMHPRYPSLESRLPRKRVRVFAARAGSDPARYEFVEAAARPETAWFFPELERGVMLYRAVLTCADDEMSDITHLFPVVEDPDREPADIQYWHQEFKQRVAAPAPPDPAPLEQAKAQVEDIKLKLRTLEQDLNFSLDQGLGLAPLLPVAPEQRLKTARQAVAQAMNQVDETRQFMRQARRQYGNIIKLNPNALEQTRSRLAAMLPQLDNLQNQLAPWLGKNPLTLADQARAAQGQEAYRRIEEGLAQLSPQDRALIPPNVSELMESLARPAPRLTWEQQALTLLAAHPLALAEKKHWEPLARAGLRGQDFFRMGLAYLDEAYKFSGEEWNLSLEAMAAYAAPPGPEAGKEGTLTLPPGYLIPWFEGNRCVRLGLRRLNPGPPSDTALQGLDLFMPADEFLFPGSGEGIQILGASQGRPLLLCQDPLAAWLLYAQAGDLYAITIATSPAAPASPALTAILESAPFALLPVSPAALSPSLPLPIRNRKEQDILAPWQALLPGLETALWPESYPAPHLARARHQGLDIRAWLQEEMKRRQMPLPAENGFEAEFDPQEGLKMSLAVSLPDLPALHQRLQGRLDAAAAGKKAQMDQNIAAVGRQYTETMKQQGHDFTLPLEPPEKAPAALPPLPEDTSAAFDRLVQGYKGMERPDLAEKVMQAKEQTFAEYNKMRGVYADGLAKADAMRAQAAGGLAANAPQWVKDVPGAAAIISPPPATPAQALARLQNGESLVLEDMDFSGQDLRGMVFKEAILRKINFRRADLRGAVFEKVSGQEIDFRDANLAGAGMELVSLSKVDFSQANCSGLSLNLTTLNEITSRHTDWRQAQWRLCRLSKGIYQGLFQGLQGELFDLEGQLRQVRFKDCVFSKAGIQSQDMENLTVQGGRWQAVGFIACKGRGLEFHGLEGPNLRFIQCQMEEVTFNDCRLRGASLRETAIKGISFRDCDLSEMCVEKCDLPFASIIACQGPRAVLRHSNLEGARIRASSLAEGSLRRTRLVNADLRDTNLYGADLYKVILGATRMEGANLKNTILQQAEDLLLEEEMTTTKD